MTAARDPRSPAARLVAQPGRFGFDAAIRILGHIAHHSEPAETARFRPVANLSYSSAEIMAVREREAQLPLVTTSVIGLTGAAGVLPRLYTEVLAGSLRSRSQSLSDFLGLLAHRFVAAFGSAAIKYRLHRAAEAGALAGRSQNDPVAQLLLSLTGYATPRMADRLEAGRDCLLHYAGLFASYPRSAERLRSLVSDWLGRPVAVREFVGSWLPIPRDQRTLIADPRSGGSFNRLGHDAAIGERAWDIQARILLVVGPLDLTTFESLLPDRPALRKLVSLIRAFLGFQTGFAINPVLAAGAVPALQLDHGRETQPRLGWNTWLPMASQRRRDAADAVFTAEMAESTSPKVCRP